MLSALLSFALVTGHTVVAYFNGWATPRQWKDWGATHHYVMALTYGLFPPSLLVFLSVSERIALAVIGAAAAVFGTYHARRSKAQRLIHRLMLP